MNPRRPCDEMRSAIGALVDDELDPAERRRVERHVELCDGCRHERDELERLRGGVAHLCLEEPESVELWERLESALASSTPPRLFDSSPRRDVYLRAAAAVAIVALAIAYASARLLPDTGAPPPPEAPPVALTVGDYVEHADAGSADAFWSRYTAVDALPANVAAALDFRPWMPSVLPGGFRLVGAKLLKDVCCYTVQLRYETDEGRVLDVFQCHDDHPVTYGRARVERGQYGGVSYADLSWERSSRRGRAFSADEINVVVVGDLDRAAADRFIAELQQTRVPPVDASQPPTSYVGTTLDGRTFRGEELHGKYVLLDFWAVWCAPCIDAVPKLNRLQQAFPQEDFEIVGYAVHSGDLDDIRRIAGELGMEYRVVLGEDDLTYELDVIGYPTYLLLDRSGRVVRKYVGAIPDLETRVANDVRALLASG